MQDYLLVIGSSVGTATGIGVALIGPTGEMYSGVLVVVSPSPEWNERLVLDEDLLDTLNSLLLRRGISGCSILIQQLVGRGIVPRHEVELTLPNLCTIEVLIVQVVRSRTTNHTTEHHLVVILAICAQGIVVVLTNRHIFDFDANSLCLISD